ncbi:uroporphyrinogen-III synthase [Mycetocola sp. CAN_C7]|uniref:uroporphyrinogen-III synthase n=1 Tax=Mycetocola sp. CAN_C7 TaxID=2787724 RepID=UPI0018CB8D21
MSDGTTGTVPGFRADQLEGFRIGVTSDRRSQDLIDSFERRGASVVHAPTLRIAHADHDEPLIADTRAILAAQPDVLLATTSYGIRRWFEIADTAGLGHDLVDALSDTAILVRGPKARGAIRATGLNDIGMSDEETTASLVTKVLADFPPGLRIAVQLHGYTDEAQLDRLRAVHAEVLTVAPYRWADPDQTDDRVKKLIDAVLTGGIDVVTFTSAPAVDALFSTAEALGQDSDLLGAFTGGVITAAVGPVTAAPLLSYGITPIIPERYRMGALIRLVCEHLEQHGVIRLDTRHGPVALRGCLVELQTGRVQLAPSALILFRRLMLAGGDVISRAELAAALPGNVDEHALEVSMSRLRQALGISGLVSTIVKRGYRIDV